jgi:hypothetical protein
MVTVLSEVFSSSTMKSRAIKKGDLVRIIRIPSDLDDRAGIGTPQVFGSAMGKTFHVQEISERGLLELHVRSRGREAKRLGSGIDIIWIEPEFVEKVSEV